MSQWCRMFARYLTPDSKVGAALLNWPGDVAASADNLSLRLMGALHHLVLQNKCPELASVFPPNHRDKTDAQLWQCAQAAFTGHAEQILEQLKSPPQTNEVRRAGILLPGFLTIAEQTNGLPFVMSELGASAGLNMNWDRYHYQLGNQVWGDEHSPVTLAPDWDGKLPKLQNINVLHRAGCDLNPIDLGSEAQVTTLLSYLWPDQTDRLTRTRAAIDLAKENPVQIDKADAIDWLENRLSTRHEGHVHVIYHTIAWQYFPEELKQKGRALMEAAGAQATKTAPLARLGFEADGQSPGGALKLTLWPGNKTQTLARADYHGRWVKWSG